MTISGVLLIIVFSILGAIVQKYSDQMGKKTVFLIHLIVGIMIVVGILLTLKA